jgi:hypothetical protein
VPKQDPNSWLQWPLPHLETWLGGSNSLRRRWSEKGGLNHFSYFGRGPGVYNWLAHIYLEVHMVLYGTWGRPVQFDTRTHFIWSGEGLLGVKDPRSAHFQLRGEKDVSIYQYIYIYCTYTFFGLCFGELCELRAPSFGVIYGYIYSYNLLLYIFWSWTYLKIILVYLGPRGLRKAIYSGKPVSARVTGSEGPDIVQLAAPRHETWQAGKCLGNSWTNSEIEGFKMRTSLDSLVGLPCLITRG